MYVYIYTVYMYMILSCDLMYTNTTMDNHPFEINQLDMS